MKKTMFRLGEFGLCFTMAELELIEEAFRDAEDLELAILRIAYARKRDAVRKFSRNAMMWFRRGQC